MHGGKRKNTDRVKRSKGTHPINLVINVTLCDHVTKQY